MGDNKRGAGFPPAPLCALSALFGQIPVGGQLLAEQLDYRIFKIGFGEVHKIDCINLIPSQNIYQSYLLNPL